jgi:hypothetical protein
MEESRLEIDASQLFLAVIHMNQTASAHNV